jgi:hypothetical protein
MVTLTSFLSVAFGIASLTLSYAYYAKNYKKTNEKKK